MNSISSQMADGLGTEAFTNRLWIVVPAFNEQAVIRNVVAELRTAGYRTLVVDDCSSDETGATAAGAGATVLRHAINLGQGAALQTGITYALRCGAEAIVTFDADGQHRVSDIEVLIDVWRRNEADVVVGSRFLGGAIGMPLSRYFLLRAAVWFMRRMSGVALTDAHNGLRLLSAEAARRIQITQNRMAHASEIVEQIGVLGLKVVEAPVTIKYTAYSICKGQKLGDSISIVMDLLAARVQQ